MEVYVIGLIAFIIIGILVPVILLLASVIPYSTKKRWYQKDHIRIKRKAYVNGMIILEGYKYDIPFEIIETDKDNQEEEKNKMISRMKN